MATTEGAMTSLPTSQILFAPQVEEPEQNRINFRDSLKFFQEQLVINGGNFPSPSTCRSKDDSRKNGPRSYRAQNLEAPEIKSKDLCENEMETTRSCRISIPTVDTILESVRVLRAIQKSQQERGSTWSIDSATQSDIDSDFQLTDEWVHLANDNHEIYSNEEESNYNDNNDAYEHFSKQISPLNNTQENENKNYEMTNTENESSVPLLSLSGTVNEICPFWPSNTLPCGKQVENVSSSSANDININDKRDEFSLDNINFLNDSNTRYSQKVSNEYDISPQDNGNKLQNECEQNGICEIDSFNAQKEFQITIDNQPSEKIIEIDNNAELSNTTDLISSTSKEHSHYMNGDITEIPENSKEILEKPFESPIEMLKIETYDDIDMQKDDYILNQSIWKDNCSPNESNSVKMENNDSDSGIGTQRSASSLSPNNPIQMQKDSWSDTCSSHYASAECSPYHSLNSVFESSQGLINSPGFTKDSENVGSSIPLPTNRWEECEKSPDNIPESVEEKDISSFSPTNTNRECEIVPDQTKETKQENVLYSENTEKCTREQENNNYDINFTTNYTRESPICTTSEQFGVKSNLNICDNSDNESNIENIDSSTTTPIETITSIQINGVENGNKIIEEDESEMVRLQKFTVSPSDLITIVEALYTIKENPAYQIIPITDEKFEEMLFIFSRGAFCNYVEDIYLIKIEDSILCIEKDSEILLSLSMKYAEVSFETTDILKIDNKMGRCVYIRCPSETLIDLKDKIEYHCMKHWQSDCLQLVHYPLKCHQNVVIIDLGSVSTRAGILMDQPTLPTLFFPTVCATDRATGKSVYGMEALQPEVRQNSNLSFPVRPSIKITKHTLDINLLEGLFKKIFKELQIDSSKYTVQICLPRNLSINAQNDLVKLLLENLKVKAVNLTNQALLTLYAHDVSTAIVVDIGDRTDVLPVVDGFIVESGVTRLPYGGQRLIHHMKHSLAETRISLSTEIDSFVVQYITENLAFIAEDFDNEVQIATMYPEVVKKTITLQPMSENASSRSITLDEARFAVAEGLFNPEMWGLDSPGIHHLVQKAIQATCVDVRKKIAENIYVSGGVTMLPGFIERLQKEVAKLSKAKIIPKVFASNYRYHCTYIGACKFAKMDVFPQVCVNLDEYNKNHFSALKKFALY